MLISSIEPCKCGSTEHSRISAKACPLHKAPRSQRARREGSKEASCITKIGFNQFLAEPLLAPVIDDAVKNLTYILFKACHLANAYILHLLDEGLPIPPLNYNDFMCLPFQAVTWIFNNPHIPTQTSNAILNQVWDQIYVPCQPQGMEWTDGK